MWLHIAASVLIGISAVWSPSGAQDCLGGEAWGETVIRTQGTREEDGLTPEQRAAMRKAGVQTFALPIELPEDISLAAIVVGPTVNQQPPCVQLVFSAEGEICGDRRFSYAFGNCGFGDASPDPASFNIVTNSEAFGPKTLEPFQGCYQGYATDRRNQNYLIGSFCLDSFTREEIEKITNSSRMVTP